MSAVSRGLRGWFLAAAVYNAVWGVVVACWPHLLLDAAGVSADAAPLARVIAMMVGVYAYGYLLIAREPERYAGLVWVGLAGKVLGFGGFIVSAFRGEVGWGFWWISLLNDVIWLPAFTVFAWRHARGTDGGW